MSKIDKAFVWYETATWLRALVQIPPGGGSVDVLLSGRATQLNQRRVQQLIADVSTRLERVSAEVLNKNFLQTDEFFDYFRTAAEIVAHTSSEEKRQLVAAYLAGMISSPVVTDLTIQVLEDLRFLQPIHLQVLSVLPNVARQGVSKRQPPPVLSEMPSEVYEKAMSDLERFGFIRYNTDQIGLVGGGGGNWETTDYIGVFRGAVKGV